MLAFFCAPSNCCDHRANKSSPSDPSDYRDTKQPNESGEGITEPKHLGLSYWASLRTYKRNISGRFTMREAPLGSTCVIYGVFCMVIMTMQSWVAVLRNYAELERTYEKPCFEREILL